MSDVMNADRYAAGIATAYGAAVQGGYTGTYAQFCAQQAQFAENAQAVEEAKQEVLSTVQTFENTTVPAAITQVQEEGTAQIQVVQDATAQQITALQEEGLRQQAVVVEAAADQVEAARTQAQRSENAADAAEGYRDETQGLKNTFENTTVPAAVQTVQNAGAAQVQVVEQAGSDQVDAVELAGSTQVGNVNTAGTTQVGNVNQAGTTQIAAVAAEGAAQVQAVEDKGDEVIASIPSEYTQLSEDVDILKKNKAPVIVEEASGQLVSIVDGADDMPIEKLQVNMEPVQDLHGQDSPYPAGGGQNLLYVNSRVSQTSAQIVYSSDDNYVYLNGTKNGGSYADISTLTLELEAGTYHANAFAISGTATATPSVYVNDGSSDITGSLLSGDKTFTLSEAKTIHFRFAIWTDDAIYTNYKVGIVVAKTTITDYSPYSNICPITGWTGCEVNRTGKNLCDPSGKTVSGTIARWYVNTGFLLHKDVTYAFSANLAYGTGYIRRLNGNTVLKQENVPFTYTPSNDELIYLQWYSSSGATSVKAQLEIAPSATEFEEYQGTTLSVTFPDATGTVYGGTFEVNEDGSGTLTVTDAEIASYNGETLPSTWISDRDVYAVGTTPTIGAQVVYKLATPQTYQLTTQQMTTLLGSNNIWADTGDVEVEYCADTKLYIELLTQPTEDDMTANANIAANRFFMISNNLYYSTSAIAAGATIIPGTNCTAISLADALNQLNT